MKGKTKMKMKYYSSDRGCIAIGCGGSIIRISNEYGDGFFLKCYHFSNVRKFAEYVKEHDKLYGIKEKDYHFISCCDFANAHVLHYDCLKEIKLENILFTLNGEYSIYVNYGKVYFVKN